LKEENYPKINDRNIKSGLRQASKIKIQVGKILYIYKIWPKNEDKTYIIKQGHLRITNIKTIQFTMYSQSFCK
jgi:hypothetical protein